MKNFSMESVYLAENAIRMALQLLPKSMKIDIDAVDYRNSARRVLDAEPDELDTSALGIKKRAVRFVLAAMYPGGVPVIDYRVLDRWEIAEETIHLEIEKLLELDPGSFVYWEPDVMLEYRSQQVVHSDLMITSPDQLVIGDSYLRYFSGNLGQLFVLKAIDLEAGVLKIRAQKMDIDTYICLADIGVVESKMGGWHPANWIESLDCNDHSLPDEEVIKFGRRKRRCHWLG